MGLSDHIVSAVKLELQPGQVTLQVLRSRGGPARDKQAGGTHTTLPARGREEPDPSRAPGLHLTAATWVCRLGNSEAAGSQAGLQGDPLIAQAEANLL